MVQTDPNLYTNDEFYYKFLFKNVRQVSVVYACRMWTFMANGNKWFAFRIGSYAILHLERSPL